MYSEWTKPCGSVEKWHCVAYIWRMDVYSHNVISYTVITNCIIHICLIYLESEWDHLLRHVVHPSVLYSMCFKEGSIPDGFGCDDSDIWKCYLRLAEDYVMPETVY